MDQLFDIYVDQLHKTGQVKKTRFYLSILREGAFSVSVERLPLIEYYVLFDHPNKSEQIKVKIYRTLDGKWYDRTYSEEAEIYSPEFGVSGINNAIKEAIDAYELHGQKVGDYLLD